MHALQLLLVEDDEGTRAAYRTFLAQRGFNVIEAADGITALDLVHKAQIVLLDVMMPGLDGWRVAEHLRSSHPDKPVIMLTSLGTMGQKLRGFELGVDDYMVKPVDLHELEARILVTMRRMGMDDGSLERGALLIHCATRRVTVSGREVQLTPLEFNVLHELALFPGKVWTRTELLNAVWGDYYLGDERTVDVRIAGIRRKLGHRPDGRNYIETVRSIGYRLAPLAAV
ncbi:MAG TPA: response regulator transcription factor [Trueperaceae bacterium]|nr:response regulator transcription factor [Trueperaceae bacterium]